MSNYVPTGEVTIPDIEIADEVRLPAEKSAVIVVDMQNDFVQPNGSLNVPTALETVGSIQRLLLQARSQDVPIAYTQDTHRDGDPEWQIWPQHCRVNTWGWEIVEELAPQPGDLVCQKSRYDGFYDTWLDHHLTRVWKVDHLVIVGTVSSICVLHTAAAAGLRWFQVVLPANGISSLTDFDQALTLRQVTFLYLGKVARGVDSIIFE